MRIAGITRNSTVDGEGIRDVLFLQGCKHHCEGCHNKHTWDIGGGEEFSYIDVGMKFSDSPNDITISGGEPLLQYNSLIRLMAMLNDLYNKRFWLYTGYRFEEIEWDKWEKLSKYVDVVVDGKFEIENKKFGLRFKGSTNQRIIDLQKTIKAKKVILWEN